MVSHGVVQEAARRAPGVAQRAAAGGELAVIADLRRRFGLRDLEPTTETTTTEERTALIALVEKKADGDLVREMLAFATERIMETEVKARRGAAKGARTPMREVQRNGYRDRDSDN